MFRYSLSNVAILGCLPFVLATSNLFAQKTINVPSNAASIQAGINAASDGDTVLVAPGTYVESVNFKGKNITVTSSAGPVQTIIEGNINGATGGGPNAAAVTFDSGESRNAVISGFTITTATFTTFSSSNGIYVFESNPTITNNIITANTSYGIDLYGGGALISNNTISNTNTGYNAQNGLDCDYDTGSGIGGGGGASLDLEIIGNTITNNVAPCEGGGIYLDAPPATTISNNIISNNQGLEQGGGIQIINAATFPLSITQNLIVGNYASQNGGGMNLSVPATSIPNPTGPLNVFITSNTIAGNSIAPGTPIPGYYNNGSQVVLDAYVGQIGFFDNLIVANDKFAAITCNPAYQDLSLDPPVFSYNDIYNPTGSQFGGWCTTTSGSGNISADPKFNNTATGDYHLQTGSPAIDTGYNAAPGLLSTDISGNPRIQNSTGISTAIVDMGAYEATGTPDSRNPSQSTISVQPSTTLYGQSVTLTANVTASSGTVTFLDDWTPIGQAPVSSSGVATLSTAQLTQGTHWLVASFGGNSTLDESASSAASASVNGYSTSTSLINSPNPVDYSQSVTLTATVTSSLAGASGNVGFYENQAEIASVALNAGTASFTTPALSDGTNSYYAVYLGDVSHVSSQSNYVSITPQDFFAYVSGNTLTINITPGQSGTATILYDAYGGFTGTITFSCAVPSNMTGATCSATPLQATSTDTGSSTLVVTTTAPQQASKQPGILGIRPGAGMVLCGGILFAMLPWSAVRRRYRATWIVVLMGLTLSISGCSGGGSGSNASVGTPTGSYTVTITASSGIIAHTFTESVVVQ